MSRLDDALEWLDLEDWASDYVETKPVDNGEFRVKTCPKCLKDKWKLYVNQEKGVFNCYSCQWGSYIWDLCVFMAGISDRHINDIKMELARSVIPSVPDDEFIAILETRFSGKEEKEDDDGEFELPTVILPGEPNFSSMTGTRIRKYANSRGISDKKIEEHQLRVSTRCRNFKGIFIVFPVYYYGLAVAWQGRRVFSKKEPKYVSSESSSDWFWPFDPKTVEAIKTKKEVILVEGVFDTLGFNKVTDIPALCCFGKKVTKNQLKLLLKLGVERIYLAWDLDAADEIMRAANRIKHKVAVSVVFLSTDGDEKRDPGNVAEDDSLIPWLKDIFLNKSMDVNSAEYQHWELERQFG